MLLSKCEARDSEKSSFIKEQETSGLLRSLKIKLCRSKNQQKNYANELLENLKNGKYTLLLQTAIEALMLPICRLCTKIDSKDATGIDTLQSAGMVDTIFVRQNVFYGEQCCNFCFDNTSSSHTDNRKKQSKVLMIALVVLQKETNSKT